MQEISAAQKRHIFISEIGGKPAVCFDTGLDPRSFARTKMSQSLSETGCIVFPDGTREQWKSSGVNDVNGLMRVWGPPFTGERLDLLITNAALTESQREKALHAVIYWIRAKMLLNEENSAPNPGAAFVNPNGSVFFSPANLSSRCLILEGTGYDRYNCPDLTGMDAAAFCAGVMLYQVITGNHPYPSDTAVFQDMREGIFMPPHLAAPGLNSDLCSLIQSSLLLPVQKRRPCVRSADIISGFLKILIEKENTVVPAASLFTRLSGEEEEQLEKEKERFLKMQNSSVRIKRFFINNKYPVTGAAAVMLLAFFIAVSAVNGIRQRPTTAGLASDVVVISYYEAFSVLDHMFMEACIQGADKSDLNAALSLFAIDRTRQAYEMTGGTFIPAKEWKDSGGELPAPDVFGVTDLSVEYVSGSEENGTIVYRTDYFLWSPYEDAIVRTDILTLNLDKKNNWRITDIQRTEK